MVLFDKDGFIIRQVINFDIKHDDKDYLSYPDLRKKEAKPKLNKKR